MLASTGMIVQDVAKFPGFASAFGESLTDNNFRSFNLPTSTLVGVSGKEIYLLQVRMHIGGSGNEKY